MSDCSLSKPTCGWRRTDRVAARVARLTSTRCLTPALALLTAWPLHAQILRGTVTERTSGSPLPGVVITLSLADSAASATTHWSVLTDPRGAYSVRGLGPGRYRLQAKRIGVEPFRSDVLALEDGESRELDIALDPVLFRLAPVAVDASSPCTSRPEEGTRVASLWAEAHAALTATRVSQRDSLFRGRLVRYARTLDYRSKRVLREERMEHEGRFERTFSSLSGDSLSHIGYWRASPDGSYAYYGPDAEVLLSASFLADHCFTPRDGGRDRAGLTGLAFQPVPGRLVPEVRGTLWLDARTFELRFVEFTYTSLPLLGRPSDFGGEVYFDRVASGAWYVSRWVLRMPEFQRRDVRMSYGSDAVRRQSAMSRVDLFREEGGHVVASVGADSPPMSATATTRIAGVVRDSAGAPMEAVVVVLEGTERWAVTDASGAFRLADVAPGRYTVGVEHPDYRTLGVFAAEQDTVLEYGTAVEVTLTAHTQRQTATRLCRGRTLETTDAVLHVTVLDSATAAAVPQVALRLEWTEHSRTEAGGLLVPQARQRRADVTSDEAGGAVFCALPAGTLLRLSHVLTTERARPLFAVRLRDGALERQVVNVRGGTR